MALEKITQVGGCGVYVPGDDLDTDRIIPARFMKCITFDGLGEFAFYDARAFSKAEGQTHPLDDARFTGASILFSGSNFGCGSSREHAPQALYRFGIRAIIAESFAEIFFGNSITLGMPCVVMTGEDIRSVAKLIESDPAALLTPTSLRKNSPLPTWTFPSPSPRTPTRRWSLANGTPSPTSSKASTPCALALRPCPTWRHKAFVF